MTITGSPSSRQALLSSSRTQWGASRLACSAITIHCYASGLLAAEVAISPSPIAQRVVGVVGLDVPFLGLHPHVIISGIASLLPTKAATPSPAEEDLNKNKVQIVSQEAAFQPSGSSGELPSFHKVEERWSRQNQTV